MVLCHVIGCRRECVSICSQSVQWIIAWSPSVLVCVLWTQRGAPSFSLSVPRRELPVAPGGQSTTPDLSTVAVKISSRSSHGLCLLPFIFAGWTLRDWRIINEPLKAVGSVVNEYRQVERLQCLTTCMMKRSLSVYCILCMDIQY